MFPHTGEALKAKLREVQELQELSDMLRAQSDALIEQANYVKQLNRRLALGPANGSPAGVPPPEDKPPDPADR